MAFVKTKFGGGDMMAFQVCKGHVDWVCRARRAGFYWPFGGLWRKKVVFAIRGVEQNLPYGSMLICD